MRFLAMVFTFLALLLLSAVPLVAGLSPLAGGPPGAGPPISEPAPELTPVLVPDDPPPEPDEEPEAVPRGRVPLLEKAVFAIMADFTGEYSIAVHDLTTGECWTYNPDRIYHPASTIKLPVALYALEQYRTGTIGWQDAIEYTPDDFETPGEGAFETASFGELYPVEGLVNRALMYSNNVAVNMLGRHLGWGNIGAWSYTIGGDLTWVDRSPQATVRSVLGWWLHLHRLAEEDPESAALLLEPLRRVTYNGRIGAGLPDGVPYLHKFGSYDGNYHDSGIIYAEKPYILIVMTAGAPIDEADLSIARLTAAIHRIMQAEEV